MTEPAALCVCCAVIRGPWCDDDCERRHKHRRGQPNPADEGVVCGQCRVVLANLPREVAEAYALLPTLLEEPGSSRGGEVRSRNPDPPMLLTDAHDLTWERVVPAGPLALSRLAENADLQDGYPPVVSTLWWRIQDVLSYRTAGETGPEPEVGSMCQWLAVRAADLAASYPPVDEYAAEMVRLHGVLLAMVGRSEPCPDCGGKGCETCVGRGYVPIQRPQPLPGVPCPRCKHVSLSREPNGDVACGWEGCGNRWRPDEYDLRQKAMANAVRRGHLKREEVTP